MPDRMRKRLVSETLLIPNPLDVDALIRTIPQGRVMTQGQIRSILASRAGADHCCPLVTGIFVRIVAEAAAEDEETGRFPIAPYWRVVRDDGSLMTKLPGGVEAQARRLRAEGVTVAANRKPQVRLAAAG